MKPTFVRVEKRLLKIQSRISYQKAKLKTTLLYKKYAEVNASLYGLKSSQTFNMQNWKSIAVLRHKNWNMGDWWPKLLFLENLFEFIWNIKSSFEIWKFNLNLKKFHAVWKFISNMEVVPCVCIQPYHVITLNTHTWHHSTESIFEINVRTG